MSGVADYIVGYTSDKAISQITKNTIAAASAGILLLLMRKKAKAAEIPASSEELLPKVTESIEKSVSGPVINTFVPGSTKYEDDPQSIFIQYPGLKVWVPQKEVPNGQTDVDQLINQARATNSVSQPIVVDYKE